MFRYSLTESKIHGSVCVILEDAKRCVQIIENLLFRLQSMCYSVVKTQAVPHSEKQGQTAKIAGIKGLSEREDKRMFALSSHA